MMSKILKKNNVIFLVASILLIFLFISYTKYEYIILKSYNDYSCLIRANNYTGNICMIAQTDKFCQYENYDYNTTLNQFDKEGYRTHYNIKLCNGAYDIEHIKNKD